jgi:type IX secretion system PorP/SprF family membrane protein
MLFLLFAVGLFVPEQAIAQQEPRYTQFAVNKLAVNPAYAGSRDALSGSLLYRHQWSGLEEAPRTLVASFHAPLRNKRVSIGAQLVHDKVGLTRSSGLYTSYAYRLPLGEGHVAAGLQAGLVQMRYSWNEALAADPDDPLLQGQWNSWLPNAGAGVHWQHPRAYAGIGVPQLLQVRMDPNSEARTARHWFALGGYALPLGEHAVLRSQGMAQWVSGAPFQVQVQSDLILAERICMGMGYRSQNNAVQLLFGVQGSDAWRIGYAYDYAFGPTGLLSGGSQTRPGATAWRQFPPWAAVQPVSSDFVPKDLDRTTPFPTPYPYRSCAPLVCALKRFAERRDGFCCCCWFPLWGCVRSRRLPSPRRTTASIWTAPKTGASPLAI